MNFRNGFQQLKDSLNKSPFFKERLLSRYTKLVERENVANLTFDNKTLTQLATSLVGQLGSPLSNYPDHSLERLLDFGAYRLLRLEWDNPEILQGPDHGSISIGCELTEALHTIDDEVGIALLKASDGYDKLAKILEQNANQLRLERIELAQRYAAIFGT